MVTRQEDPKDGKGRPPAYPREVNPSSVTAVLHEHLAHYAPEKIVAKLMRNGKTQLDAETLERDRQSALSNINGILELVKPNERPRALDLIDTMVDRMMEKRISSRAIGNVRLERVKQNLEREGGGLEALEAMCEFYKSAAFDDAIRGLEDRSSIEMRLAQMKGFSQERAALITEKVFNYKKFNQILELDSSSLTEEDQAMQEMKKAEILGRVYPKGMVAIMKGYFFNTPLHINVAFFSLEELHSICSLAKGPYVDECPPNVIRINASISNAIEIVLFVADKMPEGFRLDAPRSILEALSSLPKDAVVRQNGDSSTITRWLIKLRNHFRQFQEDEKEIALSELGHIFSDPMSILE